MVYAFLKWVSSHITTRYHQAPRPGHNNLNILRHQLNINNKQKAIPHFLKYLHNFLYTISTYPSLCNLSYSLSLILSFLSLLFLVTLCLNQLLLYSSHIFPLFSPSFQSSPFSFFILSLRTLELAESFQWMAIWWTSVFSYNICFFLLSYPFSATQQTNPHAHKHMSLHVHTLLT